MDGFISWSPGVTLDAIEQQVIIKAFAHFRCNKTTTANALGISIRTLDAKLERYGQDAETQKVKDNEFKRRREEQLARARGYSPAQFQDGSGNQISTGLRVEPALTASAQLAVSVPQRQEVQEVLHAEPAADRPKRGRPRIHKTDATT